MNDTVVRISQEKLAELILSQIQKQAAAIPGFECDAESASRKFAVALYELWGNIPSLNEPSDEDELTALSFMGEAFESIASDLCEAHFAEEN